MACPNCGWEMPKPVLVKQLPYPYCSPWPLPKTTLYQAMSDAANS